MPLKRADLNTKTSSDGVCECLITTDVLSGVFIHALSAYPFEMCGVLLRKGAGMAVTEYRRIVNRETDSVALKSFSIDPLLLFRLEKQWAAEGLEIAGFCHSHPDGRAVASYSDIQSMIPGLLYLIVSVSAEGINEVRVWQKNSADGENVGVPLKMTDEF